MSYKLLNLQKNPKFVQIYKYIKKIQSWRQLFCRECPRCQTDQWNVAYVKCRI